MSIVGVIVRTVDSVVQAFERRRAEAKLRKLRRISDAADRAREIAKGRGGK